MGYIEYLKNNISELMTTYVFFKSNYDFKEFKNINAPDFDEYANPMTASLEELSLGDNDLDTDFGSLIMYTPYYYAEHTKKSFDIMPDEDALKTLEDEFNDVINLKVKEISFTGPQGFKHYLIGMDKFCLLNTHDLLNINLKTQDYVEHMFNENELPYVSTTIRLLTQSKYRNDELIDVEIMIKNQADKDMMDLLYMIYSKQEINCFK